MDGVLYRGHTPIPGAADFLDALRRAETPFLLLTNNSARTPVQYVAQLARMGIQVNEDRILTSGQATATYLRQTAAEGSRIFLIGEEGVRTALRQEGFTLRDDAGVDYVVVGFDRALTYDKLQTAALAIRAGASFVGTNPDRTLPTEAGLMPGNGAILAAIQTATDVAPLIIGKPQPIIFELALDRLATEADETAMIGDRLDTDILGAGQCGLITVLVLSGVTDRQQLVASGPVPDLVYEDIAAFHRDWQQAIHNR
jgi:4-nitrophenyl phosphatase